MGLILVRYGEIALKGKNRPFFTKRLGRNIRACLKKNELQGEVYKEGQRIFVLVEDGEVEKALAALQDVFGIVSLSPVHQVPADIEAIQEEALRLAHRVGLDAQKSFHTAARRADKTFPYISPEINRIVGGQVQATTGAGVDLSDQADLVIGIEVQPGKALVYGQVIPGPGGLPLNTQARVVALMSGGIDSPVAAWMMMRRGCGVIPIHFSQNEVETEKFLDNCQALSRYAYGWDIRPVVVSHAEVFEPTFGKLQRIGAERWACIFCKRALLVSASQIADERGARALITGDNLGQVASQTVENLQAISYGIDKPILRPLIGMNKVQVIRLARRIGTYEVSTRQAESCCYLPPNPITQARMDKLRDILARLEALEDS